MSRFERAVAVEMFRVSRIVLVVSISLIVCAIAAVWTLRLINQKPIPDRKIVIIDDIPGVSLIPDNSIESEFLSPLLVSFSSEGFSTYCFKYSQTWNDLVKSIRAMNSPIWESRGVWGLSSESEPFFGSMLFISKDGRFLCSLQIIPYKNNHLYVLDVHDWKTPSKRTYAENLKDMNFSNKIMSESAKLVLDSTRKCNSLRS